ncbi:PREDICTED: zinc finger CCCH domain-containing protein 28-like [Camelina sativa]|uniref:Zinc finger CCCH domain-containing protein 28-like n=1 Tax=Camelina sativa TaxID=90675 RepID=A0ABM0YS04_CAMSA|nr:PREDICTED: zinc finger CCCH domain-containing protein 28-like [Camelina sativa]
MSHRRASGSDVVHVRTTNDLPPENKFPNSASDSSVWATEDDYNRVRAMPTHPDDAQSPSKKTRASSSEIGKSFFKTKLCFKFRTGTCPYAASSCHFAHSSEELRRPPPPPNRQETAATEASRNRESFAISLGPRGYGGAASDGGGNVAQTLKPPNWKTRICNKWEITGYCPFGTNCHFAHGASELHNFGGGLVEGEGKIGTSTTPATKQTGQANTVAHLVSPGVLSQRASSAVMQKPNGVRTQRKWKGPDKISRVYGDWIDDIE